MDIRSIPLIGNIPRFIVIFKTDIIPMIGADKILYLKGNMENRIVRSARLLTYQTGMNVYLIIDKSEAKYMGGS